MFEFRKGYLSQYKKVMDILKHHSTFDYQQLNESSVMSVSGLEIYPNRRKIYHGCKGINLTVKKYDLFYLLVLNQGYVLIYN